MTKNWSNFLKIPGVRPKTEEFSLGKRELVAMSIVSSKGMLVKRDLMSKLANTCPWLFFTWEISDANENESKIVNWLDVSGSRYWH